MDESRDYQGRLCRHPISNRWLTQKERDTLCKGRLLMQDELAEALNLIFRDVPLEVYSND
jgi:hypothetical protein